MFQKNPTRVQTTSTRELWRETDDCGVSRRSNRVVNDVCGADDAAFSCSNNLEEELTGADEYGDSRNIQTGMVKSMYGADDAAFPVQTTSDSKSLKLTNMAFSRISQQVWSRTCIVMLDDATFRGIFFFQII